MEYSFYVGLYFGCSIALLIIGICVIAFLPKHFRVEIIEKLFHIKCIDKTKLILSYFDLEISFLTSRRFRLSLNSQIILIIWIILLLLVDGCIVTVHFHSANDTCPTQVHDCFIGKKFSIHERIDCQSDEIISNITTDSILCFVWIYSEQDTVDIINQLGICSSVFTLICLAFKLFCKISQKLLGLIFIIGLVIGFGALTVASFIFYLPIAMTTKILLSALTCLLVNVIQLFQFTHSLKKMKTMILVFCLF